MTFVDANSLLTTKPFYFDIMCQGNEQAMYNTVFFGNKFWGGHNFLFTFGSFFNKRDFSSTDWLDPFTSILTCGF